MYAYALSSVFFRVCMCIYSIYINMSVDTSFANPQSMDSIEFVSMIRCVYLLSCKAYKTHLVNLGYEIIYVFMKIHPLLS